MLNRPSIGMSELGDTLASNYLVMKSESEFLEVLPRFFKEIQGGRPPGGAASFFKEIQGGRPLVQDRVKPPQRSR